MKSTDSWPRQALSGATPENHFEQLRGAFYTRLRWDRARLIALSGELHHSEGDSMLIFDELRIVAHRMCGAAAVFEARDIGGAASILERTLREAIDADAERTDPNVSSALEALLDLLAATNDRHA